MVSEPGQASTMGDRNSFVVQHDFVFTPGLALHRRDFPLSTAVTPISFRNNNQAQRGDLAPEDLLGHI